MKTLVMSWKAVLGATIAIAFALAMQFLARDTIQGCTKSWEGTPVFAGWDEKSTVVKMKLRCDGKESSTTDTKLIMSQLTNPDSSLPTVYLYEDGSVKIKPEK